MLIADYIRWRRYTNCHALKLAQIISMSSGHMAFGGTIAENIGYGKESYKRNSCGGKGRSYRRISKCRTGDTVITEDGINLSEAKQLLTIARYAAQNVYSHTYEATSNVDSRTEIKIQDAMKSMHVNLLYNSAPSSTVRHADIILVMRDKCERKEPTMS